MADVKAGIKCLDKLLNNKHNGIRFNISYEELREILIEMDTEGDGMLGIKIADKFKDMENRLESHLSHYTKTIAEMQTQINDLKSALGTTKKACRNGMEKRIADLTDYTKKLHKLINANKDLLEALMDMDSPSPEVKDEKLMATYSKYGVEIGSQYTKQPCAEGLNGLIASDVKTEQTLEDKLLDYLQKHDNVPKYHNAQEVISIVRSHKSTDKVEIDASIFNRIEAAHGDYKASKGVAGLREFITSVEALLSNVKQALNK